MISKTQAHPRLARCIQANKDTVSHTRGTAFSRLVAVAEVVDAAASYGCFAAQAGTALL
eukprot:SAG31_NODE_46254_length_255_cov_0.666667_1_plen_58_part_01